MIKTIVYILDIVDAKTETRNYDKLQMIKKTIFNVAVCQLAKSLRFDQDTSGEDQIAFLKRMTHQPWYFISTETGTTIIKYAATASIVSS